MKFAWALCSAALGGFHGLIDQREDFVGRLRVAPAQREGGAQQCIGVRRWGAPRQQVPQALGAAQVAQRLERQRLHAGAQGGLHPA